MQELGGKKRRYFLPHLHICAVEFKCSYVYFEYLYTYMFVKEVRKTSVDIIPYVPDGLSH